MAGVKITDLPVATALNGNDYVVTTDGILVYKSTINSLLEYYQAPVISLSSSDTHILQLSNNSSYIRLLENDEYARPVIFISSNSSIAWPIGYTVTIKDVSGYGFTLSAASGVTLYTLTSTGAAYQAMQLINVSSNVWDVL